MNRLCTTTVSLLIVAMLFTGCLSRSDRYQRDRDEKSLYAVLHKDVKPGASRASVRALLGLGQEPLDYASKLESFKTLAERYPDEFPDGVQDGDVFVGHAIGTTMFCQLQFRDDRLINHKPEDFKKYDLVKSVM